MVKLYRVGVILRVDALSPGARKGLWDMAYPLFQHFGVFYIVLAGGLVSVKDFKKRLKAAIDEEFVEQKRKHEKHKKSKKPKGFKSKKTRKPKKEKRETAKELIARVSARVKNQIAHEIAEEFPFLTRGNGELMKTYIITAPAPNYDGAIGAEIAYLVSCLRDDIIFWGEEDQRFIIKGLMRPDGTETKIGFVLPTKAAWRSKYYSTRPQRLIEDKEMQSAQRPPELWVSDCAAVGLVLPAAGDREVPIFSFPGLHRLQNVTTSENQVGIGIIEFSDDGSQPKAVFVSLKDLTEIERGFILVPEGATDVQSAIIEKLKIQPSTIGMLEDAIGVEREQIIDALNDYEVANLEPRILFDDERKVKYDFCPEWMRKKLVYPEIDLSSLTEDVIAGYSCLHAGYATTQYDWWVKEVPGLILRHGVRRIVCCGDKIAGLEHNLHLRGEIIAGLNYTQQELLSARLEGLVIFEVFRHRFHEALECFEGWLNASQLASMIDAALLYYHYFVGNHDKWLANFGVRPFATSTPEMIRYLVEKITRYVRELKIGFPNFTTRIEEIVLKHIAFGPKHVLPSGLVIGINHPEMARAQTASMRAQQVLRYQRECHICQFGNFHTAKAVLEWNWKLGERVAVENAAIVSGTEFEKGKLKTVDTAVSFLKVYSKDRRIIMAQPFFETCPVGVEYDIREFSELLPILDLSWETLKEFPIK